MKTPSLFLCFSFSYVLLFAQNPILEEPGRMHISEIEGLTEIAFSPIPNPSPSHILSSSLSGVSILDSLYYWAWDRTNEIWGYTDRILYSYDPNRNVSEILYTKWSNDQWVNNLRLSYERDGDQNIASLTIRQWDGNAWMNVSRHLNTYDDQQNLITTWAQNWDGLDWSGGYRSVYAYDSQNNKLSQTSQYWVDSIWINGSRHLFTYDEYNREILEVYQVNYGDWINSSQFMTHYDANGNRDLFLRQNWVTDHWVDANRNLYSYDADNRLNLIEFQIYQINEWWSSERHMYEYDQNSNITRLLYQEYHGEWVNVQQFLDTYDDNLRLSEVVQVWEDVWINQDSTRYFYSEVSGIKALNKESISIFPNPATNTLNISLDENSIENYTLEIYSNSGVMLIKTKGRSADDKPVDIRQLVPGFYYVLIHHTRGMSIKPFVKL